MLHVRDTDRYDSFTRRTIIVAAGGSLLVTGLLARMYQIQVLEEEKYATLADKNRVSVQLVPPLRGKIFDRFGVELAKNRKNFRVLIIPAQTQDIDEALDALSQYIEISDTKRKKILRTAKRQSKFSPITVAQNMEWDKFARINIFGPSLSGIQPDAADTREYPYGSLFSHVLGYVAAVNEKEAKSNPVLMLPDFRIGRAGVEQSSELQLRGEAGNISQEVNAYGRVIRELDREEQTPGKDLVLTIDTDLQQYSMDRLSEVDSGAAIVMDTKTGDILSLVSAPGFDPNEFNVGLSQETWDALNNDQFKPLYDKAVKGEFPPGSTFKMVVALAALEAGVISPNEWISCYGAVTLGNGKFHCWKRGGHGAVNMRSSIKKSCDVYYYEVAKRLGIDAIEEMAYRFGFGQTYDFGIPGEADGLVPSKGWKIANFGEKWQQGETLIAGIGQGYLLATPLQLAVMTARLANGEEQVRPRIIRSIGAKPVPIEPAAPLRIEPEHLAIVRDGMNAVSNEQGGTAYWSSRMEGEGFTLAGKTGTAQVRRITRAERAQGVKKNEDLPWKYRDHALYVAYAPVENPRYAISVFVEHGGSGSKAAAPVARDIMQKVLEKDPLGVEPFQPVADSGNRSKNT